MVSTTIASEAPPRRSGVGSRAAVCPASLPWNGPGAGFLLSLLFAEHDSRPTPHEWLAAKRIERGRVVPLHGGGFYTFGGA